MLTRPEVDEAEAEAETNSYEPKAKTKIASIFFFLNFTFWPHYLQKQRNHEAEASFLGRDEDLTSLMTS